MDYSLYKLFEGSTKRYIFSFIIIILNIVVLEFFIKGTQPSLITIPFEVRNFIVGSTPFSAYLEMFREFLTVDF